METTKEPARPAPRPGEPAAQRQETGGRERDEADKQIAEHLAKPPEQPVPTQEEADAIKEAHAAGGVPPEQQPPPAGETAEQRRERERREREQRNVTPNTNTGNYQTR